MSEQIKLNQELYKKVYLVRYAEHIIKENYMSDAMKTPMHMTMGGEAISAGICAALDQKDQICGTYRSHGLYLCKTGETDRFFAEMYGKVTGTSHGKAGSMHLMDKDAGLICTSAIVGSSLPVAVGAAFANRYQKNQKVVAVFFGDGAVDEGCFWESLNTACQMKLPVIFVCEDNGYAVHIPKGERHGYTSIANVMKQMNCHVYQDETTDVEEIYNLTKTALNDMAKDPKPCFMHLKYYRYLEHVGVFEDFKAGYRPKDEYEKWLKVDPVDLQRKKLVGLTSEEDVLKIERAIQEQVSQSLEKAKQDRFPEGDEIYKDLWV